MLRTATNRAREQANSRATLNTLFALTSHPKLLQLFSREPNEAKRLYEWMEAVRQEAMNRTRMGWTPYQWESFTRACTHFGKYLAVSVENHDEEDDTPVVKALADRLPDIDQFFKEAEHEKGILEVHVHPALQSTSPSEVSAILPPYFP
ncbi:hypothetical protein JCM11641_007416 [Rhodosporidiobolus odoratus]